MSEIAVAAVSDFANAPGLVAGITRDERAAAGAGVTMSFEAQPQTRMAKLIDPVTKPMSKALAKTCAEDIDDLEAAIEAGAAG